MSATRSTQLAVDLMVAPLHLQVRPCHAGVIPRPENAVNGGAAEAAVASTASSLASSPTSRPTTPPAALTSEAFRAPQPTSPGPGAAAPAPPPALGAVGAGPRGLPAPGAEPALHADHALAHAAHLDSGAALEPAAALLRVAGAGQQPGLHQQLGLAPQARGKDRPRESSALIFGAFGPALQHFVCVLSPSC